jgi:hypothetical protein
MFIHCTLICEYRGIVEDVAIASKAFQHRAMRLHTRWPDRMPLKLQAELAGSNGSELDKMKDRYEKAHISR